MSETKQPSWWNRHGWQAASLVATLTAGVLGGMTFGSKTVVVQGDPEKVIIRDAGPEPVGAQGWVNDREEIELAAETLDVQVFADTPAGQVADLPKSAYLWKAYEQLFARPPPLKDQNPTGSCVGFGTTTAVERSLATEIIAHKGTKDEFAHFSEEVTYAGSRFEANGNSPPRFRGDGSNGGWAAKFVTDPRYGMVPKAKYEHHDLTEYSASRARSWNNTGVPDYLEPVARKFPVKSAARITTWADAKKALASGYGIQIASSLAVGRQRDENGVARESGSWAHSMCLDGYHTDTNGREYGHIENSWSKTNYHTGPVGWGDPTTAGFWLEADAINRALRQGDSYAYSGATGFPARRPLDWLIRAEPARRQPDLFARFKLEKRSWSLAP